MTETRVRLNRAVAKLLFPDPNEQPGEPLSYSSRIELGWRVVRETATSWGWVWEITNLHEGVPGWYARVSYLPAADEARQVLGRWAKGACEAEAICRAALLTAADRGWLTGEDARAGEDA